MNNEFAEYEAYLREGMRVEIGIPLSGGGVFRDWAIITEFHDDEVVAQISRDMLPANVRVDEGSILDLSVWVTKDAYTCSCIVTEKLGAKVLRLRLFGAFQLQERRQFFRLDLSLRVKFSLFDEMNREVIKNDWERRKELEHMKFQGYDRYVIAAHSAQFPPPLKVEWLDIAGMSSNIGGGGIRLRFPQRMRPEELVNLEINLPVHPPRIIYTVAQVVHVLEPKTVRGKTEYPTGLQFVYLDERDRDIIFQQISVQQIALLRQHAEGRAVPEPAEATSAPHPLTWQRMVRGGVVLLAVLIVSFVLIRYLIHYKETSPPNEIGKTYEKALKQYRGIGE